MSQPTPIGDSDCRDLYQRHHTALIRFLTRMTRCLQRAEDLAQGAWLKVLTARATGSCPANDENALRAYLYAVARNAFIDECTRKHDSVRTRLMAPGDLEAVAAAGSSPGPEETLEREQLQRLIRRAVTTLPAEQRVVIDLWSRGTSIRDMAARTTAPVDTVLSRKKYAFGKLRRELVAVAPGA